MLPQNEQLGLATERMDRQPGQTPMSKRVISGKARAFVSEGGANR
jgi:hypothetical protein